MIGRCTPALVAVMVLTRVGPAAALDPTRGLSECTVETWRSSDGLPGAWVRDIAQTADGYLWIGTQAGLARYGGGPLVDLEPDRQIEHALDVMAVHAADDGRVWVTPSRGAPVCVRDGLFESCFPDGQSLPDDVRVSALHQDASGAIWIAASSGLHRFAAGRLELMIPTGPAGVATALHDDNRGRLWVGTGAGLFVADGDSLRPHLGPAGPITAAVTSIAPGRGGRLWVAAERTLLRVDPEQTVIFGAREGLPPHRLTRLIEDQEGNVWLGSRTGLVRFQPGRGFTTLTRADGLPDDDVSAVFEDREGSLWVGTRGGGLVQFTDRSLDTQTGPPGLRQQWISTLAQDRDGVLWVGTHRGLTRWKDEVERTYDESDGLPGEVLSVHPGRAGELWIGTDRGLARWRDGRIDTPVPFPAAVTSLYLDPRGTLWIGGEDGLARLTDGRLERIPVEDELKGQKLSEIRGMQHDDQGTLWLSAGGRLMRVADGRLGRDRSPDGPSFGKVRALYKDADGTLWLGARHGLVRRRQGTWRSFGAAEGLSRGDLYQVLADDLGFLWVGSSRGILRLSKASLEEVASGRRPRVDVVSFESAGQRREVGATRTRQPSAWKGLDGRLWFATTQGVLSVDPRRMRLNSSPPTVRIEKALADGRPARPGGMTAFPPGSGALEFHFAALTLLEPRKAQYRYRLDGFDPGWVEAGPRRVAYYTNLGPGHYRFRVQGSNADGVWNEKGDTLELTLAPHFYQTGWFYTLTGLVVLGLALSFHRMRVGQLHGRYAATFAERSRIARELHDSLLQGMSATLMLLRALRKLFGRDLPTPPPEAVVGEIKEIEGVVATNIEDTRRFVWDLRDEPGEDSELAPALEHLVRRLAAAHAVEARVSVEGTASAVPRHVRRDLLQLAHEAVSNALRHGQPRQVEVRLAFADSGLKLSVRDDGRGFDPQRSPGAPDGHFGLTGMRERAASLGAFAVTSQPGNGTIIEVTVGAKELRGV